MGQPVILVAEDETIVAWDLCATVEEAGYTVEGPYTDISSAMLAYQKQKPDLAILDVHATEPFTDDDPLLGLGNAHLAPHLASRTTTAMSNMSWVVRDVWRVLQGESPAHPAP